MQESKGKTMTPRNEPTIGELMADPLIRSVMNADHVDPNALETMLYSLAQRVAAQRLPFVAARRQPSFAVVAAPPIASPPHPALLPTTPREICGSLCSW
jgi:hypothetical protein